MGKRYICEQACFLGGKRYDVGDNLAEGVEPNSHFMDVQSGVRVKPKKKEPLPTGKAEAIEIDENKNIIDKMIGEVRVESSNQLNEFKTLVGEHLAKFESRIAELEKLGLKSKKVESSPENTIK